LEEWAVKKMVEASHGIARELEVKGPLNVQFIVYDDVCVIEANLRVSRSMPLVSKATGVNYMSLVADVLVSGHLAVDEEVVVLRPSKWWVKSPQFSVVEAEGCLPAAGPSHVQHWGGGVKQRCLRGGVAEELALGIA